MWFQQLGQKNKRDKDSQRTFFLIMQEYGIPPLLMFGGDLTIKGTVGAEKVNLTVSVPAINPMVYNDMIDYLKYKQSLEKRAMKKKK